MALFHFSEDPGITLFRPHVAKTSPIQDEAFVWAIDEWHSPMYYVPRDCPRACFWAGPKTTSADRERWLNHLEPRFVMVVEASWLERIRNVCLYRYTLPEQSFSAAAHGSGHHVSRETLTPLRVDPLGCMSGGTLGDALDVRRARVVVIHDTWVGYNPHSPVAAVYELRRGTGGGLSGERRLSTAIEGERVVDVNVSSAAATRFLTAVASARVVPGPYVATLNHTDDYPHIEIALHVDVRFCLPGEEIGKALAALRTPLTRATLDRMMKEDRRPRAPRR